MVHGHFDKSKERFWEHLRPANRGYILSCPAGCPHVILTLFSSPHWRPSEEGLEQEFHSFDA